MADPVAGIAGSAAKSVRPFRSSEAYVEAMKEDLAEWLNALYGLGLPGGGDGFLTGLATGTTLCQHANAVTEAARALAAARPARGVAFQAHSVVPGSFMARDNVATFIGWCRTELGVPEVLMFETEDLVLRKNEKSVVLCLLEVARRGARLGLLAPRLVQFEQEIERELRAAPPAPNAPAAGEDTTETTPAPGTPARGPRMTPSDLRNLDELVREILGHCTCPDQFPMIKVSEGKYRVGDSSLLIFVRVLRSHVMVRVGGGWDTLEHYLDKHDPCRCSSTAHRPPQPRVRTFSPQRVSPTPSPRPASPVPGSERRGSRPEMSPISLQSTKEGPGTPPSPRPELGATPASVFRTPLQLDPQQEQQLFRRLEEEFLANARALEAVASVTPTGPAPDPARAPDPPAPDSAYCSSSSSSSSLSVLGGKCGQPGDSGRTANGLPGPRSQALSSSSDEGSPCPGMGGPLDAPGSSLAGPEPLRTWARGRMDTQPDRKPSRIPTPRGPRRPSGPAELGTWHALHSVTPRAEPDSWM
ncbi:PREDICTED: GAS2-like protein 1 isoform X1 [Colobus angolensis palliatus]|uniref:GAS2-like protein 1 isoform X1 n=1 Tax=Colobus angolensis palliatus TaxID=336983 RepID=UPI0005F4EF00|nr:PREDICTED: GAS2-like protein 1 isoform X1 [Colobus angolensis palliatus]